MRERKGQIRVKHGLAKDLPKRMSMAEPGYAVDTHDIYMGMGSGQEPVNVTGELRDILKRVQESLGEVQTHTFKTDLIDISTQNKIGTLVIDSQGVQILNANEEVIYKLGIDDIRLGNLTADSINWKDLGLYKTVPSSIKTLYVSQNPTGDRTGRNTSNKAESIKDALAYLFSQGNVLVSDVSINIDGGVYPNVDKVKIIGIKGSGNIILNCPPNLVGVYRFDVKDSDVTLKISGGRKNQLTDEGAILNTDEDFVTVDNAKVLITGIRSKRLLENLAVRQGNFAKLLNGGTIAVEDCDIVQYKNQYRGTDGFTIYDCNNIGNCDVRLKGEKGVMYYGGYRIIPANSTALDLVSYVKLDKFSSPSISQGKGSLFVVGEGEDIILPPDDTPGTGTVDPGGSDVGGGEEKPPVTPIEPIKERETLSKTFNLTNLHTTVSGTGSYTSTNPTEMGQGFWGSYKKHTGHGTIPTEVKSYVADAIEGTIEMEVTFHRRAKSHGYYGAVPVVSIQLPNGNYLKASSGVALDSSVTLTLPSSLVSQIASGEVKEITTYSNKSTSEDYCYFDRVSIKVTCAKLVTK